MPKILILDTYYPAFLKTVPVNPEGSYRDELEWELARCFGTFDAYSRNLAALGWETEDVIVNHFELQQLWAREHDVKDGSILEKQIELFDPDVIFLQDLNIRVKNRKGRLIAGQCSCPVPAVVTDIDVVFTSFPHYIEHFKKMGVKAVYNPLAFDPIVLDVTVPALSRVHDVVFVGGVGNPSHWRKGLETLEHVARTVPTFKWWGYGCDTLPTSSPLRDKYQGEAWGLDMYRILLDSKIVLNRHGEVARDYANNMRMFEATGCGALLLTERAVNLSDFFSPVEAMPYSSPDEAVYIIERMLQNERALERTAQAGQRRTLHEHTYAKRMQTISDVLTEMMCKA